MRQPQNSGDGRRSHDSAGWILCWLAMVTLVSISFAGSHDEAATRIPVTESLTTEAKSPDLEIAQFPNPTSGEKSPGIDGLEATASPAEESMSELCPQG